MRWKPDGKTCIHRGDERLDRRTFGEAHAAALDDGTLAAGERLEVHARAERAARAGQDPHRQAGVAVEPIHGVGQAPADRGIDRVLGLRPVDGDDQDPVPLFDQDFGFGVGLFVRSRCCPIGTDGGIRDHSRRDQAGAIAASTTVSSSESPAALRISMKSATMASVTSCGSLTVAPSDSTEMLS